MDSSSARIAEPKHLWRSFVLRVGFLLALSGVFFFSYNYLTDAGQIHEAALKRARAHFRDALLTLRWAAGYGGVYVETAPAAGANPFPQLPDRRTTEGRIHRLRHPEGVLKEIARLADRPLDHRFHLIGRQTRDPLSAPDTWETLALDSLLGGRTEYFEQVEEDGRVLFRYMAPVPTEASCLGCHAGEGLQAGDIHGGIAIGFDITELVHTNRVHQLTTGLIILLALGLSIAATRWFSRRLDRQLRRIGRRYEDLLQSTESIVWEADPGTLQLTFISDQVQRLLGFAPQECLGPDFWFQRIHPADALRVWEELQAYRDADKPLRLDYRMIDRQGREVWMQGAVVLAEQDNGRPMLRGVMLDITERKVAEKRVQDMLAEQYAILQNAMVGIAFIRHGRIISCNHRFEEIFGAVQASLAGQPVRTLYPSEEAYRDIRERIGQAFDRGLSFTTELLLIRRDGSLFWGAMNGQLLDTANPRQGAIWIYADIAERKAAQAALKEHQARLEQLVEQRTVELRRALEAAHAADRAKDDFLANVSHEMRTPLNAVIGLAGLASKQSRDPRVHEYLDKVTAAGQTLLQIINDLLDLSKIASGHLALEAIPFRLADIADKLRSMVSLRLLDKRLAFEIERDPALPEVLVGDPLRVEQIALNLVTNAIKFTEQGRVAVRFARHAAPAGRVGLTIVVEDTGCGIAPAEQQRLFQPFSQADHSIARTHGGTGLGLTICRRFAQMMEGDISVASAPGKGSSFTVRLTLGLGDEEALAALAQQAATDAPAAPLERIRYRDTRILVVDDQPINRQIVRELVAEVGIDCDEAEDGRQAVAAVAGQAPGRYALVLMDVQMPEMDGYGATRAIRDRAEWAQLPIIAMTAFAMEHERRACLDAGMNDHLAKPFDPARLFALLARWIPADRQYIAAPAGAAPEPEPEPAAHGGDAPAADALRIPGIDTQAGIVRFAGNRTAYRRWLATFAAEGAAPLDAVTQALGAGDRAAALRALHAFKGHCGMLGMTALWQAVADLESALKEERAADALFAVARRRHDEVLASLQGALS